VDTESPFRGLFAQASSSYAFTRVQDAFEAVNTYYFVDTYMRYINETLGVTCDPYQYAGGVRYDPHGLSGADNSHYTSGNGVIAFGEGGVDDDEDSDVIIHELGHGIHDWLTSGGLSQVNGLSEVTGQIHTDGQIWSTCLMRIWDLIGQQAIDKAVFVGLSMTGSGTNQQDAANAVVQAALNMGYSDPEITAMVSEFEATGYNITVIGVGDASSAISAIRLHGAAPNPFNPMTRISFELPSEGRVRLDVFNAAGQHVRTLLDEQRGAGLNVVPFDAAGLGSGVYFYQMTSGEFSDVRKMTLLK
jgi:hypothetical protein